MAALFEAATSWRSLLSVVLVFGFAPGVCLRLIVLMFPPNDRRRHELIRKLYSMRPIHRPIWVAVQLEVAIFEGLFPRLRTAWARRRLR